jgi:glycerophosphoryl diester phosphodiesterase
VTLPQLILAHRGDWTVAPENSLAAFVAAASRPGVDGVEFDVRAAQDGTPVVIHDVSLRRVQGVAGRVRRLSPEALAALGVPSLASVLAVLPEPCFLDVELKDDVAEAAVPLLASARGSPPRRTVVSSFLGSALGSLGRVAPDWPTWLLTRRLGKREVADALAMGCAGLAVEWPALRPSTIELVRAAALQLATWTVATRAELEHVRTLDVDVICADPEALPG